MEKRVYSLFDSVAKVYGYPFIYLHDGEAVRFVSDLVGDERSNVNRHPADYKLYRLGKFDDVSGALIACVPDFICNAIDFVKIEKGKEESNGNNRK